MSFFRSNSSKKITVELHMLILSKQSLQPSSCTKMYTSLRFTSLHPLWCFPFNEKWFIDDSVESDDKTKQALNHCVLERAPCSVGILVDRSYLGQFIPRDLSLGPYVSVAMIFFGGSEDREALSLAKQMSWSPSIPLTVVRFIAKSLEIGTDWEKELGSEVLKDIKPENNLNQQLKHSKEMVNDGQETVSTIEPIAEKYDLIRVGRRKKTVTPQTSGLDRFREFPEHGVVGNFLVTEDIQSWLCKNSRQLNSKK